MIINELLKVCSKNSVFIVINFGGILFRLLFVFCGIFLSSFSVT